jgi:hypothetical protein
MIKIKVCDLAPRGACSYYRGIGPLSKLRHLRPDIQVEYLEAVSWATLSDCDILFLMRPVENTYIETLELAKSFGVPVWVDFDDILHEIPKDNPGYEYFTKKSILENLEYAIKSADIVSFSTIELYDYYKFLKPDAVIIPNAFNNYNYKLAEKPAENKYISWRGSNTHRKDLLSQKEGMVNISVKFSDWQFAFIGGDPLWYMTEDVKNSSGIAEMEISRFNRFLINLSPAIHIVPLVDSIFNRGKSNISYLEGTSVGAACLCPSLPEFEVPGAVNYTDNFEYLLEKLIKSKSFRAENWEKSLTYIKENLMLSEINQLRLNLIEKVLNK